MRPSFFYGYVILALCFVNMVFMRGVTNSFSVFYPALLEEFHWPHATGATIASVNFLVYALMAPVVGWIFDRVGPRAVMTVGGGLMAAGLLLSGASDSLKDLYLYYGILTALGQAGLGFVSTSALLSYWFVRHRATAMGVSSMGQGLGALLILPLSQYLISNWGWRHAFKILSALIVLGTVPANALFQRLSPVEMGQFADGETARTAERATVGPKRARAVREWTLREALRSFPFRAIIIGHVALGTGLFIIYTHIVVHLVQQGLTQFLAAFVAGLLGFMRIVGTALWGLVSDRMGRGKAYGAAIAITLIGVACLVGIGPGSPIWLVYLAAVIYGIGHSAGNPTYGALIGDIFGGSHVGRVYGLLEVGFGLGSALGAWLGGAVYDATGSYRWAFALGLGTFTISYLSVRSTLLWQGRESGKR